MSQPPDARRAGAAPRLDRAVHPRVDGAHEIDGRARGGADLLGDRSARLGAGEPGVALFGQAAERVPAFGPNFDRIDFHRAVALDAVPVGDRHADVLRGEADLARLRRLRDRALGDQREGVRADLFGVGLVQHLEFFAGDDRLRRFEAQTAFAGLDVDGVGRTEAAGAAGEGRARGRGTRPRRPRGRRPASTASQGKIASTCSPFGARLPAHTWTNGRENLHIGTAGFKPLEVFGAARRPRLGRFAA